MQLHASHFNDDMGIKQDITLNIVQNYNIKKPLSIVLTHFMISMALLNKEMSSRCLQQE